LMGPGGEAPPSGSYLQLDKPIRVGGMKVSQIYLMGQELKNGAKVDLSGRIDLGHFGGVETPEQRYIMLDGVSNVGKGEPRYDGHNFNNKDGDTLPALMYKRPFIEDAPAELFVPDARSNTIYLGSYGGMLRWQTSTPFWGFSGTGNRRDPDALDRK